MPRVVHGAWMTFCALASGQGLAAADGGGGPAGPSISECFTRTGESEALTVPLTTFGGVTTVRAWSGTIEVTASGVGFSTPGSLTDPFHGFLADDPAVTLPSVQGLRLSFAGCAANVECGAPYIDDFITFIEGQGEVIPPSKPPYSRTHEYRFVIDVGPAPRLLTFGEGDGGVWDNWGRFEIGLFGVTRKPEVLFRRGDSNQDGDLDISDALAILLHLFAGAPRSCTKAFDVSDDGRVDLGDPLGLLSHFFADGLAPPEPFRDCGTDPTADVLSCEAFPPCG